MVKKTVFSFFGMFLFISCLFSQEKKPEKRKENFFYTAPFDLFFNTLQLCYEKKLKNHNSVALLGGFKLSEKEGTISRIGGNGEIQYRINLFYDKETKSTIALVENYSAFAYFAPYLQYKYEEITDNISMNPSKSDYTLTIVRSYFGGAGFGVRFTGIESRLSLNIFAGGGLKYSELHGSKKYTDFFDAGYTGFAPKLGFQIGIAF